ncbi:MAG: hypothetical protein PHF37_08225 [Phycisphaerae bacterium]|nr:hypothetical protein [Phycisphaerae bacterium]
MSVLKELTKLPENHPRRIIFEKNFMSALRIEVSVAFADQRDADFYDPGAPSVMERMDAIKQLRKKASLLF